MHVCINSRESPWWETDMQTNYGLMHNGWTASPMYKKWISFPKVASNDKERQVYESGSYLSYLGPDLASPSP